MPWRYRSNDHVSSYIFAKFYIILWYTIFTFKILPYDVRILINIAQVYIKKVDHDEALEYLSRTLYLDPNHVKALSRKAFVLSERGEPLRALELAERALTLEKNNPDLAIQVEELVLAVKSIEDMERIKIISDK